MKTATAKAVVDLIKNNQLSVPYTLGWRLQRPMVIRPIDIKITFSSLYFGMKTATSNLISDLSEGEVLSVPYTLGWRLQLLGSESERVEVLSLSVPYTLGWRLQLCGNIKAGCTGISFQFPILWDEDCNWRSRLRWERNIRSFSSLYCGMKTATQRMDWWSREARGTFSSLYFGMKTATGKLLTVGPKVFPFQFPILWDEDCNIGVHGRMRSTIGTFSSLYFGMKTATRRRRGGGVGTRSFQFPILWDEDCNLSQMMGLIYQFDSFSSLYFGMKTATTISFLARN